MEREVQESSNEIGILRKIVGITRLDHMRNELVSERLRVESGLEVVKKRREC